MDNMSESDFLEFVGKNQNFWKLKYNKYQESQSPFLGFNAGVLLYLIFWLLYRKMYLESLLLLLITTVFDKILSLILKTFYINLTEIEIMLINTPLYLFLSGLFVNFIYIKHAERIIKRIRLKNASEAKCRQLIKKKGGTSILSVIIALLIIIGLIYLASFATTYE